ncbi:MAG: hypothetical protein ACXVHB_25805 [Solirubrobacteraceae bacterium]
MSDPLAGASVAVECILGLEEDTLIDDARRANGDCVIDYRRRGARVRVRMPARFIRGYVPRGQPRPRDYRRRRKDAAGRLAMWVLLAMDPHAPIVERWIAGDLEPMADELRAALIALMEAS